MADYRQIHIRIWDDEWFSELSTEGKLLWIYLFSNRRVSICGIYRLPERIIGPETGLLPSRVAVLMNEFQQRGKIDREGDLLWVKKLRDVQGKGSPKVTTCINADLAEIPYCALKARYLIAYGYPIDTLSAPARADPEPDPEPIRIRDVDVDVTAPARATPSSLFTEPLCQAYIDVMVPGGSIPRKERPNALAAILRIREHPCYELYLADKDACTRLWEKYFEDHDRNGERKPLQYYEKWIIERLTGRGRDNGTLPADWEEEE